MPAFYPFHVCVVLWFLNIKFTTYRFPQLDLFNNWNLIQPKYFYFIDEFLVVKCRKGPLDSHSISVPSDEHFQTIYFFNNNQWENLTRTANGRLIAMDTDMILWHRGVSTDAETNTFSIRYQHRVWKAYLNRKQKIRDWSTVRHWLHIYDIIYILYTKNSVYKKVENSLFYLE